MELKLKGHAALIDQFKQLTVSMKWTTAADFDLAAIYQTKEGKQGIVYFGDLGNLNAFPYINLNKDEGVGDKGGNNEEVMRISRLDDMNYVWVLCWDYNMVQRGKTARFKDSDVNLTMTNETGNRLEVTVDTGDLGNVCCLATIDNTGAVPKLINASKTSTLKELKTLEQLINIVQQREAEPPLEVLIT
jgi:tellurite resistance protein TerA